MLKKVLTYIKAKLVITLYINLTNDNLKIKEKKLKKSKILNAALIGFLAAIFVIGTVASIYSKNALGMIPMLIPIFLIYKIVRSSKKNE
tara:strand:+ start:20772 stop:21038 length:267 start_codon:yes stop_codon:yes gene_type:complete